MKLLRREEAIAPLKCRTQTSAGGERQMKQCLIETVPVGGDSADFIDSNCVKQLQATKGEKTSTHRVCLLFGESKQQNEKRYKMERKQTEKENTVLLNFGRDDEAKVHTLIQSEIKWPSVAFFFP